jgi:hypothetical protein
MSMHDYVLHIASLMPSFMRDHEFRLSELPAVNCEIANLPSVREWPRLILVMPLARQSMFFQIVGHSVRYAFVC